MSSGVKEDQTGKLTGKLSGPAYGDENDPHAINRLPSRERAGLTLETQVLKKKIDNNAAPPDSARSTNSAGSLPTTFSTYSRSSTGSTDPSAPTAVQSRNSTARIRSASATSTRTVTNSLSGTSTTIGTRTALSVKETISSEIVKKDTDEIQLKAKSSNITTKPSAPKFDIYIDNKTTKQGKDETTIEFNKQVPSSSSLYTSESVGYIQHGIQHIILSENNHSQANGVAKKMDLEGTLPISTDTREERWSNSTEKIQPKAKRAKEAWISSTSTTVEKNYSQALPSSSGIVPTAYSVATKLSGDVCLDNLAQPSTSSVGTATTQDYHALQPGGMVHPGSTPTPALQSEPMCVGTPPEQVKPLDYAPDAAIGTLEKMHEMLNENSFSFIENNARLAPVPTSSSTTNPKSAFSKVWVVRYVDYTSKYGLGFLFNTGSAGVYFNDSTKIVLSPDGKVFQYIERKRRESGGANDHCSQKHRIDNYPPELQKKVTLLKHFKEYLINQERNGTGNELDHGFGGNGVEDCGGFSKQVLLSKMDQHNSSEDEPAMPFLKKWIKTKHAILFRLSNRTVQVVFYDKR